MEIELTDHYDRMNKVVGELLKGNNPSQIATITGFKRAEVLEYIDQWKEVVRNDSTARERAKEAISGADQHYAMLIKEAWKTVEDADQAGQLNVKATALKLIADIEGKRIAVGEPRSVPVGQYSEEVLKNLGILEQIRAKLVFANLIPHAHKNRVDLLTDILDEKLTENRLSHSTF